MAAVVSPLFVDEPSPPKGNTSPLPVLAVADVSAEEASGPVAEAARVTAAPRPRDWVATDEDGIARVTPALALAHWPRDAAGRLRHTLSTRRDGPLERG